MSSILRILPAALLSALSLNTLAKDGDEDVLVTATRTPTKESDILVPVTLISRADIERSLATDATDILRFQAGIDIGRNGGPGQPASLFLRGTESNHTVVLVDGVRINPGLIGGAALENIAPETIDHIEIVRGPRSTLYGSDAIGGVINIFTRGAGAQGVEAYAGAGRYDSRTASLSGGFQGDGAGLGFSASWLDSDGFPTLESSNIDRGYKNLSLSLQGRWQTGAIEWRASAWHANGRTQYADFFAAPVDSDYEDDSAALEAAFAVRDGWRMRLRGTLMKNDIDQNQSEDFDHTRRFGLEWQNDVALGSANTLTFGAAATRENTESLLFGTGFDVDTDVHMAYLEDRMELGRHHLLLAGGYTHHETAGSRGTWNVDYGFDVTDSLRVLAAGGSAFRAPDSTDRFGFGGNPDLDPETSRNLELGLQWRPAANQRVTLSAFRNDIRNLIVFVITDPETFDGQNENVERARIEGVEATWRVTGATWRLQAGASVQNPRNLSEDSQLLRRAKESLTLSFVRSFNRVQLGADLLTAGARKDFGFPTDVTLAGYTLLNVTGRFSVTPNFDISARIENALDDDYELASGYNTPKRSLFVGARYRFGAP